MSDRSLYELSKQVGFDYAPRSKSTKPSFFSKFSRKQIILSAAVLLGLPLATAAVFSEDSSYTSNQPACYICSNLNESLLKDKKIKIRETNNGIEYYLQASFNTDSTSIKSIPGRLENDTLYVGSGCKKENYVPLENISFEKY